MVLDLIFLAVIIAFIIGGIVRGFAKSIMNIAAVIAACVFSDILSSAVAEWIFNDFIRDDLIVKLSTAIERSEATATNIFTNLPDWASSIVAFFCVIFGLDEKQLVENFAGKVDFSKMTSVQLADGIAKPVVTGIFGFFLVIIIFILLIIVFKLIINFVNKLFELPIISPINRVLGGVFGGIEGVVVVLICLGLLALIMDVKNSAASLNEGISGIAFSVFKR